MKKIIDSPFFVFFIILLMLAFLTTIHQNNYQRNKQKFEIKIGEQFILDKDTLTIVNYSMFSETFTLSDGRKVSASLILQNDN